MKATRGDDDGQVNNPNPHIKKPKWNYLPTHFSKEPVLVCLQVIPVCLFWLKHYNSKAGILDDRHTSGFPSYLLLRKQMQVDVSLLPCE